MIALLVILVVAIVLAVVGMAAAGALAVMLRDARRQAAAARATHVAEIERITAQHTAITDRILHMQQYGTPEPAEGRVTEREPDAESRVLRRISEESITVGAAMLKQEYEQAGVVVTDEEVRIEAESMLLGVSPSINPRVALRVKD